MIRTSYIDPNTVLFMDYGSNELRNHLNMQQQFIKVTSALLKRHIFLESRIVPNGEHCEACWEKQIPFFMNTLFYEL